MKAIVVKIFLALAFILSPSLVWASVSQNMTGFAWSSNIGWVSFNSTDDSDPSTPGIQPSSVSYGVHKNSSGWLCGDESCATPGYAWSPTIGWIQFGGLSGFPTGSGTYAQNAQVIGTTLRGWAKALSADGSGWDGWISLSGSSPAYGVNLSGMSFSGFAWGGEVVGWLSFSCNDGSSCGGASYSVSLSGDASLDVKSNGVSLSGNTAVPYNTLPTFEWTLTNIPSATCSITKTAGGSPFTSITGITSSGSVVGQALSSSGPHTYSIDCVNPTISKQISFTVAPQPPGFSLGGTDTAKIQFLAAGSADSQIKNIFVSPQGGYTNPVTIKLVNVTPTPPSGTTILVSLGGGTFSANPAQITINSPYSSGTTVQARVSKKITTQYTVHLLGTGSDGTTAEKAVIIDPTAFDPKFEER